MAPPVAAADTTTRAVNMSPPHVCTARIPTAAAAASRAPPPMPPVPATKHTAQLRSQVSARAPLPLAPAPRARGRGRVPAIRKKATASPAAMRYLRCGAVEETSACVDEQDLPPGFSSAAMQRHFRDLSRLLDDSEHGYGRCTHHTPPTPPAPEPATSGRHRSRAPLSTAARIGGTRKGKLLALDQLSLLLPTSGTRNTPINARQRQ